MDEKVYKVVEHFNRGDAITVEVSISHLIKQHGLQAVSEAEKSGYIMSMDNNMYWITTAGEFLLLTSVDSRELSTSFDTKNNTLVVHLRGNSSIQMNIELQKYSNKLWIKFRSGDESFNLNNLDPETLGQLINTLTMFKDDVLNTKEDTAGEDNDGH